MIHFLIRGTTVLIQPLFMMLCALSLLLGGKVLPALCALMTHELGHLVMARALKVPITRFELTPFGGIMVLEGVERLSKIKQALLAAFGPLFSFLGCVVVMYIYQQNMVTYAFASSFIRCGSLLMFINLLPAPPLDGGKVLCALLSIFMDEKKVRRRLLMLTKGLSFALMVFSLIRAAQGKLMPLALFAGVYLLYASAQEGRSDTLRYVDQLLSRRGMLGRTRVMGVQALAACGTTPTKALLPQLNAQKYHTIHILSEDGQRLLGTLNEEEILNALLDEKCANLLDALKSAR